MTPGPIPVDVARLRAVVEAARTWRAANRLVEEITGRDSISPVSRALMDALDRLDETLGTTGPLCGDTLDADPARPCVLPAGHQMHQDEGGRGWQVVPNDGVLTGDGTGRALPAVPDWVYPPGAVPLGPVAVHSTIVRTLSASAALRAYADEFHHFGGGHGPVSHPAGWLDPDAWCVCGASWDEGGCIERANLLGYAGRIEADPRTLKPPASSTVDGPDDCARIGHVYLSTACAHGRHDYCDAMVGARGEKRPATCKWGAAACVCPRHLDPAAPCGPPRNREPSATKGDDGG